MADEADRALRDAEVLDEAHIKLIREQAAMIPKGRPGECNHCGEYFERLVGGHCGRCRDLLKLP
ncbi:hypothetical protein [Pseudomonas phage pPA-3099-2aT.3]|nr:hypothetical protein [Pseudomonas phage pPA-3099-2aT.3]